MAAANSVHTERQWVLKPHDLVVALKMFVAPAPFANYRALAASLFLSTFEAHASVRRLIAARLVRADERAVRKVELRRFLEYGAPYCYPAIRGEITIGTPTAYAVAPLLARTPLFASDTPPVWPHLDGKRRGAALMPLYSNQPLAALADPGLYELLALFDALRIGQARERKLARELIDERMGKPAEPDANAAT